MSAALIEGNTAIRLVNGRVVSPTLTDPDVKKEVDAKMGVLRKDVTILRAFYVSQGVITKGGNLTKRYGG